MQPREIIHVDEDTETIGCDGGGGPLGHPMVYYTFGSPTEVECQYCGRRFTKVATHQKAPSPHLLWAMRGKGAARKDGLWVRGPNSSCETGEARIDATPSPSSVSPTVFGLSSPTG